MDILQVTEIFHSIQGESTRQGFPCVFVRLTGCPLRCRWCDTAYAFHGGEPMSVDAIVARVETYATPLIEVTGGEPLAQRAAPALLKRLADLGSTVLLETSGALSIEGLDPRVRIVMDLKCPDSGEAAKNRWENLGLLKADDEVKFVLASRGDYLWARGIVAERFSGKPNPILFSSVWRSLAPSDLAAWILEDRLEVRLQIQLHKVLYGESARGV